MITIYLYIYSIYRSNRYSDDVIIGVDILVENTTLGHWIANHLTCRAQATDVDRVASSSWARGDVEIGWISLQNGGMFFTH